MPRDRNVLGEPLTPCYHCSKTGFTRWFCRTGADKASVHSVRAMVTEALLEILCKPSTLYYQILYKRELTRLF